MPSPLICFGLALITLAASGCATKISAPRPGTPGISGVVSYREPITLPSGSMLHLTLLDAAKGTAVGPLASSESRVSGGAPIAFHLPIMHEVLSSAGQPLLFAQILVAGRPWFSNAATPVAVDTSMLQSPLTVPLQNDMRPL